MYVLDTLASLWDEARVNEPNPFYNTGCVKHVFPHFEVEGYSWADPDEYDQPYNFKWRDYEVTWYKYLGRGMEESRVLSVGEQLEMLQECALDIATYTEK